MVFFCVEHCQNSEHYLTLDSLYLARMLTYCSDCVEVGRATNDHMIAYFYDKTESTESSAKHSCTIYVL